MNALDVTARGLARQALDASAMQSGADGASAIGTADGGNVQQAIDAAATPDELVALETAFVVGSHLRTADGHRYRVVESGGDLVTAGLAELKILPDAKGEYHFEAAAPNTDMNVARRFAIFLPAGSILNVSGSYIMDSSAEFANKIHAKGPGKWTLRPGGPSAVVQLSGSESEWYVELDGNRDGITGGTPSALSILSARDCRVGAKISNAVGNGIHADACPNLVVTAATRITGCGENGILVANGSDGFTVEGGARIYDNDKDNIYVLDGAAPCRNARIGSVIVDGAGKGGAGYWCGVRLRNVDGFEIVGARASGCQGAGIAIQSSVTNPQVQFSRNGIVSHCLCTGNNDGIIVDDYSRYVTTIANQCNDNLNDGIDINDARYCKSMGDTCVRNGQQGILLWGAQNCHVHRATCLNNHQSGANPSASGIYVQTNVTTGGVPANNKITHSVCGDDQPTKTQVFGIRLVNGTGHVLEDNDVSGNITAGINDATGNAAQNPKRRNKGYRTESTFWAVIPAGSTSVVVSGGSTGLVGTGVTIQRAIATPIGAFPAGYAGHSLSGLGTQGMTINIGSALASDLTFNCTVSVFGDGAGL